MILVAIVLALIQVLLISQLDLWGVSPLIVAAMVYIMRSEVGRLEIATATATFAVIVGIFQDSETALLQVVATVMAALLSIQLYKTLASSRLRARVRGYDALIVIGSFTVVFWTITALPYISKLDLSRLGIFVVWSLVTNLVIAVLASFSNGRLGVAKR